jgi:hypothetical protein
MSYYLGPATGRWAPANWEDVVQAAASGALDETTWVELKEAIPPASKGANLELAKDLASLAVEGGLLVIGVQDDKGKAGEVVGSDQTDLEQRIDQVARDRIHPPLVAQLRTIEEPSDSGRRCVLVTVDASALAPHMVDDRYWGRGATGKRALSDAEVRQILDRNRGRREASATEFREYIRTSIAPDRQALHLMLTPVSGRRESLAELLFERPYELIQLLKQTSERLHPSSLLASLTEPRPLLRGIQVSNFNRGFTHQGATAAGREWAATLTVRDDGQIALTCPVVGQEPIERDGALVPFLRTTQTAELVLQVATVTGVIADAAGYGGQWDAALLVSHLRGVRAFRREYQPFGTADTFPDDRYEQLASSTTTELVDNPATLMIRLLMPLMRLFGAERVLTDVVPRH